MRSPRLALALIATAQFVLVLLDCGVQRHAAHRFYFREGMRIGGYHFEGPVADGERR